MERRINMASGGSGRAQATAQDDPVEWRGEGRAEASQAIRLERTKPCLSRPIMRFLPCDFTGRSQKTSKVRTNN